MSLKLSESVSVRLPVELYEEILRLAAWDAHEIDKAWLCALACTVSRRVWSVVRPVLYHTVCITTTPHVKLPIASLRRVVACARHGSHFALTRCLWVDIAPDDWHQHRLAAVFPNVHHFAAGMLFLDSDSASAAKFRPTRFTLRVRLYRDDWRRFASSSSSGVHPTPVLLSGLTHLRLAVDPYFGLPPGPESNTQPALSEALALRYVILESTTPGWNPSRLHDVILPFFLGVSAGSARLERLVVCATTHAGKDSYMKDAYALLEMYAAEHQEQRLWVLDAPTDGGAVGRYCVDGTFDEAQWMAGRQVYTGSASDGD